MNKGYVILLLSISIYFLQLSCNKQKDEIEENILFDLDASGIIINPSDNFAFNVILKSKMPSSGIKIEVSALEEATSNAVIPQPSPISSTTISNRTVVKSLPRQKWVVVSVKVSSVKISTNTSTREFKIIYK